MYTYIYIYIAEKAATNIYLLCAEDNPRVKRMEKKAIREAKTRTRKGGKENPTGIDRDKAAGFKPRRQSWTATLEYTRGRFLAERELRYIPLQQYIYTRLTL